VLGEQRFYKRENEWEKSVMFGKKPKRKCSDRKRNESTRGTPRHCLKTLRTFSEKILNWIQRTLAKKTTEVKKKKAGTLKREREKEKKRERLDSVRILHHWLQPG